MSMLGALCCLPSVKKQKHGFDFCFVRCIIKQLLDSVFVISRIMKVSVRGKGYQTTPTIRRRLITLTETFDILNITKTSSNYLFSFTRKYQWLRQTSIEAKQRY